MSRHRDGSHSGPARVDRLLGTTLGADAQREVLRRVGIETEVSAGPIGVEIAAGTTPESVPAGAGHAVLATVPTWRRDIEIEADLAEEIARIHGYEQARRRGCRRPRCRAGARRRWRRGTPIRAALAGAGLTEVVTYALVSARMIEAFGWTTDDRPAAGEAGRQGTPVTVTNPLSMDHSILRQSLVGSLVEAVDSNARHGEADVAIFEVGKGYGRVADDSREWWRLGLAFAGAFEPPHGIARAAMQTSTTRRAPSS